MNTTKSESEAPIRYYFDEHVRAAIVGYLRSRAIDVLTTQEAGRANLRIADVEQLAFATEQNRILVSSDSDFLNPKSVSQLLTGQHRGIVYLTYDVTISIGAQARYLRYLAATETMATMAGQIRYYEPIPHGIFPDD
jgi:predicted nuclease of predicted toxin-antitoxin system